MTSLVLGVAGAAVGFAVGGPMGAQIGFMAGSMVGSLLDPPKSEGPRLSDLKLQKSSYGQMIPIVWGTGRIAGNIIDQTDLTEHSHKTGGKGGPQVTNYSYSASWLCLLTATPVFGQPAIKGISRIWWNSKLVWPNGSDAMPCTVYLGDDDQMPDPTFEGIHGVGNQPAYRGYAYVVFTDKDLTDGNNTIGQWEFEVWTEEGDIPRRISTFERIHGTSNDQGVALNDDGTLTFSYLPADSSNPHPRTVEVRELDGTLISTNTYSLYTWNGEYVVDSLPCKNNPQITAIIPAAAGVANDFGSWYRDNTLITHPISDANGSVVSSQIHYFDGFVYTIGQAKIAVDTYETRVRRYRSTDGLTSGAEDASYTLPQEDGSNWCLSIDEEGCVYCFYASSADGHYPNDLLKFSSTLDLMTTYEEGICPFIGGAGFAVWNGLICTQTVDIGGQHWATVYRIDPGGFELIGQLAVSNTISHGGYTSLGNGLVSVPDGIISLSNTGPVPLSTIVGNLSDMTPAAPVYDVSELTDLVNWYAVASNMTVRNAIQPLRSAFFFDAVESDDEIKFRKRGGASAFSIPDDDLCAHAYGEDPGTPLKTVRKKESDLPRAVSFSYIDIDADFQEGTQQSIRQVTRSQSDVSIQVPIGFTPGEAQRICMTLHAAEWMERETFEWSTSRKWAKLEPCDVITVRGRIIRIQTRVEQPDGVIKWTGVLSAPSIYTQSAAGSSSGGDTAQPPPAMNQATDLYLLDIPLIADPASQNVYWAAATGHLGAGFRGYSLQRSIDGGTSYSEIGTATDADAIGTATNVLANFTGGNTFDERSSVTVIMRNGAELSSVTRQAILNGANIALLGSEVFQYRDATLIDIDIYKLTGLLRGRQGTEWAMPTHAAGDLFVGLPSNLLLSARMADYGATRLYKPVTIGSSLSATTAQSFTLRGVAVTPYSPTHFAYGTNAAGDWIFKWRRRARVNGTWRNFTDVPLDETTEAYRLTLWTDGLYAEVAATFDCSTPTLTIPVADQPTAVPYASVAQIGILGPGYDTLGRAPVIAVPPPSIPPATGVPPPGVQWHEDYVFSGSTHSELNANWLMDNYGSSWCWCYVAVSRTEVSNVLIADLGVEGNRIINTMLGAGYYAPDGFMVPWGSQVLIDAPVLHSLVPLVSIPLPYPDDDAT